MVKTSPKIGLFLGFLLIFAAPAAHAILNNNVRVDRFKWMKTETEHFEIYYDKSSEKLVPRMAHYLEKAWTDVGEKLDYDVEEKTPFFFYSNHNEFEQTNVVPIGEGTGGVTEAFKNRFLIFNDGSESWMKHVIYHEYGHVVQFNVLYGGFWKSIRLLKSPFYPLWAMEGIAEYVSGSIDSPNEDMVVRDAVYHGHLVPLPELQGFAHLKPNQVTLAYKTGSASMHFLADEYGKDKVGKLLKIMESHFDISSAIDELIGSDLYQFDFRFREWLQDRYHDLFERAKLPTHYGPALTYTDGLPQFNHAPAFSKDGNKIYFFSDRRGGNQLFEYDIPSKKTKPFLGIKWRKIENIHAKGRALSVSADGRWLAFAGEKKQRDFLYLYDFKKEKLKKIKVPFDQIRSPVFSPVADQLVCVGMTRGFNDIYLIDRKGKILKRLTNNPQDERNPTFTQDGQYVLFSGEVLNEEGTDPKGRDLFEVSLQDQTLNQVTQLKGAELEPEVLPDGSILFTRSHDQKEQVGFNLFKLDPDRKNLTQITDLIGGAFSPRWNKPRQELIYIAFNAGERHLHQYKDTDALAIKPALASTSSSSDKAAPDWDDTPRRPSPKILSRISQAWPSLTESSVLLEKTQPYRFRMSTDIFLPFFFFSTQDGFVVADVWQISDYLGNHQVQQQLQYASKNDLVDFAGFYTYARFRPQFTFGGRVQRFFEDFDQDHQRREVNAIGIMSYPLDRVNSVNIGVGATDRKDRFLDNSSLDADLRDRFWLAGFFHDTVTGRYLVPNRGRRFSVFYQEAVKEFGGNEQFRTGGAQFVQYARLPRESALATRLFYGRSVGDEPQVFRLGGVDRVRGVSRGGLSNKKTNIALASGELRFRLKYLHARTRFLFPDFFFKAAYLVLFDDVAFGWDNARERRRFGSDEVKNSAGVGIAWPTFILQSFQINLTVQWAKRTDNGSEIWYVTLGPTF